MKRDRWAQVARVYELASERPIDERDAFLDDACADDEDLRRQVDSLLAQHVSRDGVIERVAEDAGSSRPVPTTIGRYRVRRLIGEGGMGAVYEAEQDQPRRTVALKVLKSAWAAPDLLRRFARESEVLGRLQHPNIAQVYEAGRAQTDLGPQPYFAMEFIRGVSLLAHADQNGLNIAQKLELMIKICEAVDYAHRQGVIHRDLKPSNILVDQTGEPKILDFGVARVVGNELNATRQTSLGDLVGTLEYMSPEQLLADPSFFVGGAAGVF